MVRKLSAGVGTVFAALTVFVGAAMAQTPTPIEQVTTEVNTARDSLLTFITGTGIPLLFGLLLVGVALSVGVRMLRRGVRQA